MTKYTFRSWAIIKTENEEYLFNGQFTCLPHCLIDVMEISEHERQNKILKDAIQKLLSGINFSLDENFSRKAVSSRLKECRAEAIKILKS